MLLKQRGLFSDHISDHRLMQMLTDAWRFWQRDHMSNHCLMQMLTGAWRFWHETKAATKLQRGKADRHVAYASLSMLPTGSTFATCFV